MNLNKTGYVTWNNENDAIKTRNRARITKWNITKWNMKQLCLVSRMICTECDKGECQVRNDPELEAKLRREVVEATDKKRTMFYVTEKEKQALKEYLKQLRA